MSLVVISVLEEVCHRGRKLKLGPETHSPSLLPKDLDVELTASFQSHVCLHVCLYLTMLPAVTIMD